MEDSNTKRLFLLDAYALIYRAYYALIRAPRVTSKGLNTSAIFGFCNTLDEILRKEQPTHIAVCFDPSGGTFRHELYPEYKANRDKQPEDITLSVPYIKEILAAYRIPAIEVPGYEADDVIGTLSRHAEAEGFTTYMMTPDKDYGQLVTDSVLMYRPALRGEGFEVRSPQQVCERYGISSPTQVIDLLALEGDTADNIPGCPGVGEKTAAKLINEWGSVENLLANTDNLKGALQKKIIENADKIRFSKELVTIKTDVPLPEGVSIESFRRQEIDTEKLLDVYRQLEFRSFIQRLGGNNDTKIEANPAATTSAPPLQGSLFDFNDEDGSIVPAATVATQALHSSAQSYQIADTDEVISQLVSRMADAERMGLCVEANGDEAMTASISGIAIAEADGIATYIPLDKDNTEERLAMLAPLFGEAAPVAVSHDLKRDILLLRRCGLTIANPAYDTSVAHYLVEPEMKHGLSILSLKYLDFDLLPPPAKGEIPSKKMDADRACERADAVLRLMPKLEKEIAEGGLSQLLIDIELPLTKVLAEMEWNGVKVNVDEFSALSARFSERLAKMEEDVYEIAGVRFNIASPMQVGEVLFDRLKIDPKAKRTKSGAYSTTEEVLEKLRPENPIVDLILKIRALRKLLTTYVNALPSLINPRTGKIHSSFNQTVTATGRISSTNPNLQNIPVRSEDGREIRRAFIPEDGNILLAADYSQIELRLMADMSGDASMISAFLSGEDIHRATAAKIYHEEIANVTADQRRNAKTANFGIIYGISAFGLASRLGISRSEAKELIDGYFRTYPGVKDYMERSILQARDNGYVTTVMGRKRMLPDIHSRNSVVRSFAERNAINAPLQGSAADIIKLAMVDIYREMSQRNLRSRMILQVHDELVFDVVPEEKDEMIKLVTENMVRAYTGRVPMEVGLGMGENWLEAH